MTIPDSYTWRARIAPVLVVAAPLLTLAVCTSFFRPGFALAGLSFAAVLLFLMSQFARDAGKHLEAELFRSWGGKPTLKRLQFRSGPNEEQVVRLHAVVEAATGTELPSVKDEAANPAAADVLYEDAVKVLRELTRNRDDFRLVFSENVNYGFRRNLLGLRRWGLGTAVLSVAGAGAFVALSDSTGPAITSGGIAFLFGVMLAIVFALGVTPAWVRIAAEAYADRLFGAAEILRRRGP